MINETHDFPLISEPKTFTEFHKSTFIKDFRKKTGPNNSPKSWIDIDFKGYPRFDRYKLPKPKTISLPFSKVMKMRKSGRTFAKEPLSASDLSQLLHYSAGHRVKDAESTGNRYYPSAGARYSCEVYPIILNVRDAQRGIYHYHIKTHTLEHLWSEEDLLADLHEGLAEKWAAESAVVFAITGIPSRNTIKYGVRGYRHVLMESGSILQNFYLIASALDLSVCAIGGFKDSSINAMLDVSSDIETTLAIIAVGNKPSSVSKKKGGDKNE